MSSGCVFPPADMFDTFDMFNMFDMYDMFNMFDMFDTFCSLCQAFPLEVTKLIYCSRTVPEIEKVSRGQIKV